MDQVAYAELDEHELVKLRAPALSIDKHICEIRRMLTLSDILFQAFLKGVQPVFLLFFQFAIFSLSLSDLTGGE